MCGRFENDERIQSRIVYREDESESYFVAYTSFVKSQISTFPSLTAPKTLGNVGDHLTSKIAF